MSFLNIDPTSFWGAAGTTTSIIILIPAAVRAYTKRNDPAALSGISLTSNAVFMCNAVAWFIYAIYAGAYWTAVPSVINFPWPPSPSGLCFELVART